MRPRLAIAIGCAGLAMLLAVPAAAAPTPPDHQSRRGEAAPEQTAAAAARAAAERYLETRSAAVMQSAAGPRLEELLAVGTAALVRERLVAQGKVGYWRSFGERPLAVSSRVMVAAVEIDEVAGTALVGAYVYSTVTLRGAGGGSRQEGEGIDHRVSLRLVDGGWQVTADDYIDTAQPAYLRCAVAPAALVRRANRRLVDAATAGSLGTALCPALPAPASQSAAGAPSDGAPAGRVLTTLTFDRAAAAAYADKWTSEADVTGVSHNGARYNPAYYDYASNGGPGDCTPFASQCIRAGGYPYLKSWYYDFGNPFAASPSWYNNNPQRTYLNLRYFDRVAAVTDLKKGDLIYYDWNADGYLDHTAVYVGIYDGVRCIDAHTTDHRRHAWKLGDATTRYFFYSMRDRIVWPLAGQ
jgi:hypothetical protein